MAAPSVPRPAGRSRRATRRRARRRWLAFGLLLVVGFGIGLIASRPPLPTDLQPLDAEPARSELILLDAHGVRLDAQARPGRALTLAEMGPWLPDAVVAVEDRRFYRHGGIDLIGIGRAAWRNLLAWRIVEGGSTISQQLAKLAFLTPERSFTRKFKEACYAFWLELWYDKPTILAAYLNRIYLGGGAYGVEAAARRYFAKPARDLSLAEAALLAGLIRAPSHYTPNRDLATAHRRAALVLDRMVEAGFISRTDAELAKGWPAAIAPPPASDNRGYFADWVASQSRLYQGAAASRVTIETTLDPLLQGLADDSLQSLLARDGAALGVDQGALVAMTPDGRVRAMVGGRSYRASQFNRVTQARRQPGSAFKLFLYLAALEAGFRPEDEISGRPITVAGWQPRNFDDAYPPALTLQRSLARSVNTAAVRLAERIGRGQVVAMARRLGVTAPLPDHPSLTLGSGEVSLLELTAAYATVANGGRLVWPEGISRIAAEGRPLYERAPPAVAVLTPAVAAAMTGLLQGALVDGTGWRAALPGFVAGKTGTSSSNRDAWFIGFTRDLVVGVWIGNDDGRPSMQASGGNLPARIFRYFVERVPKAEGQAELVAAGSNAPATSLGTVMRSAIESARGWLRAAADLMPSW